MKKQQIKQIITDKVSQDGMMVTGIEGVQLFRVTTPFPCTPVVYEPTVTAILSGTKEAILDGQKHTYDSSQYLCCATSMPMEAGTPTTSAENPLLGVSISLNTRVMTELIIGLESTQNITRQPPSGPLPQGLAVAHWDDTFTEALLRLLQLTDNPADIAVLADGRLRELYHAILKGEAGGAAQCAFGVGNEIARTIEYLSSHLDEPLTIDDMAEQVGMSRAVFHRKFKQATTMSPIQFVKSMRLNNAAMKIASGMNVNTAAMEVGYASPSQFSREFKRMYGQSPKQWSYSTPLPAGIIA